MGTECLGLRSVWALLLTTCTCNLNSKSMTHPAPTDHRPWLDMTQLIKFNRESVCDSKIFYSLAKHRGMYPPNINFEALFYQFLKYQIQSFKKLITGIFILKIDTLYDQTYYCSLALWR